MTRPLTPGDIVHIHCHIMGPVQGTIKRIRKDITNGQPHAEIEILPPAPPRCFITEPVINLRRA